MNPAGIDAPMTPICWIAMGRVLSPVPPDSLWPISDAMMTCPDITAFIRAWQENSSQTLRFISWSLLPWSEVAPAPLCQSKGLSVATPHHDARLPRAKPPDARDSHARPRRFLPQRRLPRGGDGHQQLIIIAAGQAGFQPFRPRRP